jgi:trehalose 6-phosphate phosphatase
MSQLPPPPDLPPDAALFLDFDGTLAPIVARPELVGPDPRRTGVLRAVRGFLGDRVAVISGRAIDDLDRFLDGTVVYLSGVHGLERRGANGAREMLADPTTLDPARWALSAEAEAHAGLQFEDKGLGVALHYRAAPELREAAEDAARAVAEAHALNLQLGHMVAEVRARGPDKGDAARAFMDDPLFAGGTPIFVGDDLTDQQGFRACSERGGYGVAVGPRALDHALYRLTGPDAVLDWLERSMR